MAKTYDEAVRKARLLADGLSSNIDKVGEYGIAKEDVDSLLALADDGAVKSKELDELRALLTEKTAVARAVFTEINMRTKSLKLMVKPNVLPEFWINYGIEDKR